MSAAILEQAGMVDFDPTGMEERGASGGQVPPGVYRAMLIGAKEETSKAKGTPDHALTFEITDGIFKGSRVTDTLWVTDNARSKDRLGLFGKRLGLFVVVEEGGKKRLTLAAGKESFLDCLDTPCLIETHFETYERDDGGKGQAVRLTFAGVMRPDDPDGMKKLAGGGKGGPGGKGSAAATAAPTTAPAKPEATKAKLSDL